LSSPIDKFLKELSSEAAAKAKPATPRNQVDAVMSDSGLFDVHALVSPAKKPAAPAVDTSKSKVPVDTSKSRPPAPAADTSKSKPPATPSFSPGRKPAGPTDAVMSDSGLFDVRGLVNDLKSKKPAAGGGSLTSPAALSGGGAKPAPPKRANVQDFELFDFRDGVGGDNKADAKADGKAPTPGGGSSKFAPLAPPKLPAAPADDDNNPIMSDSGLFDVRELVAEVNKRPAAPAKPRLPAKAEAPTELGVAPVRRPQEPVRPQGKPRPDADSKISVRPVGKPVQAIDVPSRNNVKPVGPPKTGSGKIPVAPPKGAVIVPGSRSGKTPVSPPSKGGVGKTTGGKVPAKSPPAGKKPAPDLDDIVAHRDDPNTTAEERMARREATRQGKAYKPPIAEESTEQGSSTATLILLLLVVLAGGAAAFYYFYGVQS
jgi:hypothetical protein